MVRAEAAEGLRLLSVHALTWLDVFTATPFTGNGLAVVHDADAVPDATMLAVARETRLSETTFVQPARAAGADYRNRIWTIGGELRFAGHPSLGTAVAVAAARGLDTAAFVQETQAGTQPLDVERAGDVWRASMLQGPAVLGDEPDPARVLEAAGLSADDGDPGLPPQVGSTGEPHLLCPVRDAAVLDRVHPDPVRLAAVLEAHGCGVLYLAALSGERAVARSFFLFGAPVVGEDPATGSAAGPLCAYAHARTGAGRLRIAQGEAMGRPSVLDCAVDGDGVRVAGDCVVLMRGEIRL